MPPAKRAAKPKTAEVTLPNLDQKKGSIKFTTDVQGVAVSNIYLRRADWEEMGSPTAVKVTIEPA
jgi:hypothetical protein